ncbi:MAG: hypothetical protein E6Q97_08100 [Desulfurellales bacterium]|nr:MAG: hypothetical protein E6Q97_08100 [Desulfurellales bacterium]
MLNRVEDKLHILHGDDLPDAIDFVDRTARLWPDDSSVTNTAERDWDFNSGWHGALKLARSGWEQGIAKLQFEAASVQQAAQLKMKVMSYAGEYPDVARFCAGEPAHMVMHRRVSKPVINLIVNVCCSGSVKAASFAAYGAAVAALIDQLENEGHRVELDVVGVNGHSGKGRSICGWKVKRAGDALDLNAVAFSIAHPAAFRRIMFAMLERLPKHLHTWGYGSVQRIERSDAEAIGCGDAVLLDGVGKAGNGVSATEMNKRLKANVRSALGIEIQGE